jgi:hypothetical protein
MGQTNSRRVSHKIEDLPNSFRDDQLRQILNDLDEENTGKGYSEVEYLGSTPFVDKIVTYEDNSKTKKRAETTFAYSPLPFVQTITKVTYDEETGTSIVATTTATVNYNANKTVNYVDVVNTRP